MGDVINLAVFSEEQLSGHIDFELSDANGRQLANGRTSGGHLLEVGFFELETTGLHSFTLDGTNASGNYTLGLAKIDPPEAIDISTPLVNEIETLGDRQYFSFDADKDELLKATLSHDNSSNFNGQLRILSPDDTRVFYKQPQFLRLRTTDSNRTTSNPRGKELSLSGDYVIEVGLHDIFADILAKHLGTYQIDINLDKP